MAPRIPKSTGSSGKPGDKPSDKNDQRAAWAKNLGLFSVIVADLVGCVGVGAGLGYLAVKKWNAPAWIVLITTMAGFVVAMYRLYRISELASRDEDNGRED